MTAIKVTFSCRDDVPIGTIEMNENMACMFSIDAINDICHRFRETFNEMGDPLDFRIEYLDKDI